MLGDGLNRYGSVLEMSYAYESDQRLREELEHEWDREAAIEDLKSTTQITEQDVLIELVDCGLRSESLHVLTLVPMVAVAWANGYVERGERLAILKAAEEQGLNSESTAFELLNTWLQERPDPSLLKTWQDYVAAVRRVVSDESFSTLRDSSIAQAIAVGEAAGGCLGFGAISRAEQTMIDQLKAAFSM